MNNTQIYLDRTWFFIIYALALFPILPKGVESVLMIGLFLISVTLFILDDKKKVSKYDIFKVLMFSILFVLYVFGLLYSENLKEGFKFIVRTIPIILFPVIFGVLRKNKLQADHIRTLHNIFIASLFFGLIFVQFYLLINPEVASISNWEYRNEFERLTGVHGTYYSVWIAFGIFIVFFRLIENIENKLIIALQLIVISYFIYWQLIIEARLPLAVTALLLLVFSFLKIKKGKISIIVLLVLLVAGFTMIKPNNFNRIKKLANYDFSMPYGDYNVEFENITSEQIRNGIYYCSVSLIKKSVFIGYGIGDVDDNLQNCYKERLESNVYQLFNYNSHNQYFHILLSSGIIGLILFFLSLFYPLYISFNTSNYVYLLFSILILISLLTENILSRHDGILFYSFFNSIFAFSNRRIAFKYFKKQENCNQAY